MHWHVYSLAQQVKSVGRPTTFGRIHTIACCYPHCETAGTLVSAEPGLHRRYTMHFSPTLPFIYGTTCNVCISMNVPRTDRTLRQCLIVHLISYKRPPWSDAVKTLVSHTACTDAVICRPLLCPRIGASPDCERCRVNRV